MKICVTGGKGMVGSCIQEIARKKYGDHQFFFLSRSSNDIHKLDLTNRKDVMDYFKNKNYDYVIHLAANVGGLYKNMERNVEMFNDNMRMNQNILEDQKKKSVNTNDDKKNSIETKVVEEESKENTKDLNKKIVSI